MDRDIVIGDVIGHLDALEKKIKIARLNFKLHDNDTVNFLAVRNIYWGANQLGGYVKELEKIKNGV